MQTVAATPVRTALVAKPQGRAQRAVPAIAAQQPTARAAPRSASKSRRDVKSAATEKGTFADEQYAEATYLTGRANHITKHFPTALSLDDFAARLEIALFAYGFTGENSIACTNVCRDEITITLKQKIDQVFGAAFNTNGLGGVITCGVTGFGAGLSHSPIAAGSGKERYIFFSFPHIAIDEKGVVGGISRPARPGASCACGALAKALGEYKASGLPPTGEGLGVHDPLDPEYSILKQRLDRRLRFEGADATRIANLDLVELTKVAERTITDDLEFLVSKAVNPAKADYAVVTGVQIHCWKCNFDNSPHPNLEFVAPSTVYAVVNGEKTYLDLNAIPALTPRQMHAITEHTEAGADNGGKIAAIAGNKTVVREVNIPFDTTTRETWAARRQLAESLGPVSGNGSSSGGGSPWPAWQTNLKATAGQQRGSEDSSVVLDFGTVPKPAAASTNGAVPAQEAPRGSFIKKLAGLFN